MKREKELQAFARLLDVMDDLRLLKERGRNGSMNLYRAVSA